MEPINRYIDHAVLKPGTTLDEARREIQLGVDYQVRTVCVRPADIELARSLAAGSQTGVSCVLAFPHGAALAASKADEARRYIDLQVAEIDMVVNYAFIRSGAWDPLANDIRAVTQIARPAGVKVKAILETAALDREQIMRATEVAIEAQADFVKTSTGFGDGGATEQAVAAMLEAARGRIAVKASGGIRDRPAAERFIEMGCTRLGVGSSTTPVLCGATGTTGAAAQAY
jgi:deoxyribose-phosphate aldolase